MIRNTQNKQSCLDFGHLLFFVIFAIFVFDIDSSSSQEINNYNSCKKINGNYRIYGNSCTDHCLPQFNKYLPCIEEIKYGCDCGDNNCFYQGKCLSKIEFEPIYKGIQKANQKKNNKRIKEITALMNQDPAYSQFIHDIFANYKDDKSDETKSQAQLMSEKFRNDAANFVESQQARQQDRKQKPNVAVAIEAASKPIPQPPIPTKVPQFFIDKQAKEGKSVQAKLPSDELDMIFPVIPLPDNK